MQALLAATLRHKLCEHRLEFAQDAALVVVVCVCVGGGVRSVEGEGKVSPTLTLRCHGLHKILFFAVSKVRRRIAWRREQLAQPLTHNTLTILKSGRGGGGGREMRKDE